MAKLLTKYNISFRQAQRWSNLIKQEFATQAVPLSTTLDDLESKVLKIVTGGASSVGELSRQIDRSEDTVLKIIDSLRSKSFEVNIDELRHQVFIPEEPKRVFEPTEFKYFKKLYRIGLVSDTHLCSKYQQLTLLHDAYKIFDDRGVDFVLHAGDLHDGMDMYRGQHNEIFIHGADEQKDYSVEHYPRLYGGRKTYIIGGQHDRSFFKINGFDIMAAVCKERKDLVYRGFFDARFVIKGIPIDLKHPGGGVAYARSYKMQKIIENMIGFITTVPSIRPPVLTVFGHWHIPCHLPSYMGIDAVSMPCFQSATPYLTEKGLMPVIGCAIAEIQLDKDNHLTSTKIEFIIMNSQIREGDWK